MRIARFAAPDGSVHHGRMVDEGSALIARGGIFDQPDFERAPTPVTRLLAPVSPPNIFAIGLNYRKHAQETGASLPDRPLIFIKATTSLNNPGDAIVLPASAPDEVDYEAEIAIVIGRRTKNVSPADAKDHVLGYTCANDVSARDCQKRLDKQWARGKSFDTFCPLGPWIVTADGFDPDDQPIESRLNGRVMQSSSTSDLIFSCMELVSYLSRQFTLLPGTVILTGTPEGVGMARTPPVYMRDGDRIEVTVGGIGTLTNPVTSESDGSTPRSVGS